MDIEKKFKEVKNIKEFRMTKAVCENAVQFESIKKLNKLLNGVDEKDEQYGEILEEIEKLNKRWNALSVDVKH